MKSTRFRSPCSYRIAIGCVLVLGIVSKDAVGQTWNGGGGNWGNPSNWTPSTLPNNSCAISTFNAVTGSSPLVSLASGPFTVSVLNLNNEVNGGFTFSGGTLQLSSPDQFTPGVINIQSHNPAPDLDASARLVLVGALGLQPVFINTVFADSTLTIAGTV